MDSNRVYMEMLNNQEIWNVFERIYRKKEEQKKAELKEKCLYFLKQKAIGLLSVVSGIITPIVLDGDATASIFFVPMGIYLLITKKHVLELK